MHERLPCCEPASHWANAVPPPQRSEDLADGTRYRPPQAAIGPRRDHATRCENHAKIAGHSTVGQRTKTVRCSARMASISHSPGSTRLLSHTTERSIRAPRPISAPELTTDSPPDANRLARK